MGNVFLVELNILRVELWEHGWVDGLGLIAVGCFRHRESRRRVRSRIPVSWVHSILIYSRTDSPRDTDLYVGHTDPAEAHYKKST